MAATTAQRSIWCATSRKSRTKGYARPSPAYSRRCAISSRADLSDLYDFVIGRVGEQFAQYGVVRRVPPFCSFKPCDKRATRKCHVADGVQNLVAHKLIRKAHQ